MRLVIGNFRINIKLIKILTFKLTNKILKMLITKIQIHAIFHTSSDIRLWLDGLSL